MPSRRRPRATASASCTSSSTTRIRIPVPDPSLAAGLTCAPRRRDLTRFVTGANEGGPLDDAPSDVLDGKTDGRFHARHTAVFKEPYRYADLPCGNVAARVAQGLGDPRTDPAGDHAVLDGDD